MKKLVFWFVFLLLLFGFMELLLRIVFPVPEVTNFNRIQFSPNVGDESSQPPFLRNTKILLQSLPDTAWFEAGLNLYGFRDKSWRLEKKKTRIMVLGDSFIEGQLCEDAETIPTYLNAILGEEYEVMNFGMIGATLQQYLDLAAVAVPLFKPDFVILSVYANDFPSEPTFTERDFEGVYSPSFQLRFAYLWNQLQAGSELPFAWKRGVVNDYPAVPNPGNPWTQHEAEFAEFVSPAIAQAMKAGQYNPWAVKLPLSYANHLQKPLNVSSALKDFKGFLTENESELLVAYLPSKFQVSDYYNQFFSETCVPCADTIDLSHGIFQHHERMLGKNCLENGIPFAGLSYEFKKLEKEGIRLYYDYDPHLKPLGNEVAAQWLHYHFLKNFKL